MFDTIKILTISLILSGCSKIIKPSSKPVSTPLEQIPLSTNLENNMINSDSIIDPNTITIALIVLTVITGILYSISRK